MGHEGFRANEINFLQEQNNQILEALERAEQERTDALEKIEACKEKDAELNSELQTMKDKIDVLGKRLQDDKAETIAKDGHVKVLSEQNKQMLEMLETEETKSKDYAEKIRDLEAKNRKLQVVADAFDTAKAEIEKQVAEAKTKCAEIVANVKGVRGLNETLRANIQNTEAKTRVEIEALGQALQVVDQKNLEYMTRISKQETREQQLKAETADLNEEVEKVRIEIDNLRKQLEGDDEGRIHFERSRSQMEKQIEALEVQADTLKKALSTAERANEQLQEENRTTSDRCRETADKVYALMDSLRLNQVELRKQEAENTARDKKITSLERQTQNLQAKISMETDARVLAEQERKEAEQDSMVLKKKNKKIEESVTQAQQAQEKAEREIADMGDRVAHLQTNNAYLASRIDGQEEEKNSLKSEIKKIQDRANMMASDNTRLRNEIEKFEEEVATADSDKQQHQTELAYIKREDVLDEGGRQRPVLIQSTESDLLEKLQVNEFLYEAQQARNPIPPMVEKIAQLLAMLHEGQQRADMYLGDLSKSNGLVSALRQRNMALFSRTQMFESFKTRALLRYVMNLIEGDLMGDMHLDSLSFGQREMNEMMHLLQNYDATDKVFVISLTDNGLDDGCLNLLLQLAFGLPYLRKLDLRRNCISEDGKRKIIEQLKTMEGITSVIPDAKGALNVHSGNQVRIRIDMGEQIGKDQVAKEVDFSVQNELSHQDADPFLSSDGGQANFPFGPEKGNKQQAAVGAPPAQQPPQRSPQQTIPESSTQDIPKTGGSPNSTMPMAPVPGGPPVGLGGPGNVAALNKKNSRSKDRLPDPKKRQARRAKAAPPGALDYEPMPAQRVLDKWQSGASALPPATAQRPSSASRRSGSHRSDSRKSDSDRDPYSAAAGSSVDRRRMASMDRSCSMPTLRAGGGPSRRPPLAHGRI
mmetsp:Transcript_35372/g.101599  ORF Transcript_35372/g.101599 Transcript_35372/m.101599 type:complete len:932 (-) Transcript_35372:98-2893(-)